MSQLIKKSNFSATCNRLNQYIKEKKSIPECIIGGLNTSTVLSQQPTQESDATLDLFPGAELKQTCTTNLEVKQLTILYNGEVVNFYNIDAEKAGEIIAFATSIATLKKAVLDISMPMARRTSLQRFLEKRKDRINSNTPYSSKQAEYDEKSWLQLGL